MVQLLTAMVLLTMLGAGAAQADCLLVCPPPTDPPPDEPAPAPDPDPLPPPPPAPTPPPDDPPPGEQVIPAGAQRLLELINQARAEHGLRAMTRRTDVEGIAIDHSIAMAKAGDIWHNDEYFTGATKKRLGARTVGENVAVNESIDDAHARLMRSPGHRANILNPAFVVVGIGVVQRDGASYYITQDFLEPIAAASPSAPPAATGERPRGAAAPAPSATAAPDTTAAPPTTDRREHFPNGIASATSPMKRAQAGAGPSDARSAVVFAALALVTLAAVTTGRWVRAHRGRHLRGVSTGLTR